MVDRIATVCVDSAGQGAVDATSSHAVIIVLIVDVVIMLFFNFSLQTSDVLMAHADIWAHENLKEIFGYFKLHFHNE